MADPKLQPYVPEKKSDPKLEPYTKEPLKPVASTGSQAELRPERTLMEKLKTVPWQISAANRAFNHGIGNAVTFGHSPQVQAALETAPNLVSAGINHAIGDEDKSSRELQKYIDARDGYIRKEANIRQMGSGGYGAGELATYGLMPTPFGKTGALEIAGGKALIQGPALGLSRHAANAALLTALQNPGDVKGKFNPLQLQERIKNATGLSTDSGLDFPTLGNVVKSGAGMGTLLGVPFERIPKEALGTTAAWASIPKEELKEYMMHSQRINSARSGSELKKVMDDAVGKINQMVAEKRIPAENAQTMLQAITEGLASHKELANRDFAQAAFDSQRQIDKAQAALEAKISHTEKGLEGVAHTRDMDTDVSSALDTAKDMLVDASRNRAYGALEADPQAYRIRGAAKYLRKIADDMNIQGMDPNQAAIPKGALSVEGTFKPGQVAPSGSRPATRATQNLQSALYDQADYLEKLPINVPAKEVKKVLQQLDKSEQMVWAEHGFDSELSRSLKAVRSAVDTQLKNNNPKYAQIMADEVAPMTDKYKRLVENFGDENTRRANLANITHPNKIYLRRDIEDLGRLTGHDFENQISGFEDAQRRLKEGIDTTQMPEQIALNEAEQAHDKKFKQPSTSYAREDFVNDQLANDPNHQMALWNKNRAEANVAATGDVLAKAEQEAEPAGRFPKESSEAKIRTLQRNNDEIDLRQNAARIQPSMEQPPKPYADIPTDAESHTNPTSPWLQEVDDRGTLNNFEKPSPGGSRRVNTAGSVIGTGMGMIGGKTAQELGHGFGTLYGLQSDMDARQQVKGLLDHYIRNKGAYDAFTTKPVESYLVPWMYMTNPKEEDFQK